ncbi:site-specific integrase [Chryseobacterium cucumeris]|uniref:Site-specific integrase n=1 Tax=Chryseobacterium cucumeris TaxID=1813611 RepID=A0ABX9X9G6_9FLAO|nr:site-specific integrase [Chryseobacterium cucumeris]MDH5033880.1 site-specific integrase [Chryseobacterium cucumeris]ROH94906.1 site-specific integrase [Chryseobacterium cucumeris]
MLEKSLGVSFFLKTPWKKGDSFRFVYLRVTVDGVPKEISTKRKWDSQRWNQNVERAIGNKEDARSLNQYLDSIILRISNFRTELISNGKSITTKAIIDFIQGNTIAKTTVLQEFQKHNDEMLALVEVGDYAKGTHDRYVTARSHVKDFILHHYECDDIEFRDLNYSFIINYEFYLKTTRKCSNNTTLKYIANFKKIVLRAIAKEIITKDPFKLFKSQKTKLDKKPLTSKELSKIENKVFSTDRLNTIRDVFVFQCYTGLAYIDVKQLRKTDIKDGIDGSMWIISKRQKTKSRTDIPLLEKAVSLINKYRKHPFCLETNLVLPVKSNQKMNEYLKEIASICEIEGDLNTHRARRTFGSTVTLKNGVPIHVVKEMMGHHSVTQTEDYAITTQEMINREMQILKEKLKTEKI